MSLLSPVHVILLFDLSVTVHGVILLFNYFQESDNIMLVMEWNQDLGWSDIACRFLSKMLKTDLLQFSSRDITRI